MYGINNTRAASEHHYPSNGQANGHHHHYAPHQPNGHFPPVFSNGTNLPPPPHHMVQPSSSSSSWQMPQPKVKNGNGIWKKKQQQNGGGTGGQPTKLKLVMVGIGGVGKSSLTIQFVQQYFITEYDPTISDSYTKSCFVDDALYRIEVVDTAGQEEYSAMREQHLRTGDGFLLVFSVTNRQSLEYVLRLRKTIERLKDREHFPMLLVGNKCDLDGQRQISRVEAEDLAACLQISYIESSAKFRQNVDQIFHTLIRQIRQFRYLERRPNGNLAMMNGGGGRGEDEVDWAGMGGGDGGKKKNKKKDKGKTCRIQ